MTRPAKEYYGADISIEQMFFFRRQHLSFAICFFETQKHFFTSFKSSFGKYALTPYKSTMGL